MRIEHIYRPGPLTCQPGDTLITVARRMHTAQVGVLAVCVGGRLVGIISERDLVRAAAQGADLRTATVEAYATSGVHTAELQEDATAVAHRMLEASIRHMPVVDEGSVIGMVSMRDLFAVETWA